MLLQNLIEVLEEYDPKWAHRGRAVSQETVQQRSAARNQLLEELRALQEAMNSNKRPIYNDQRQANLLERYSTSGPPLRTHYLADRNLPRHPIEDEWPEPLF